MMTRKKKSSKRKNFKKNEFYSKNKRWLELLQSLDFESTFDSYVHEVFENETQWSCLTTGALILLQFLFYLLLSLLTVVFEDLYLFQMMWGVDWRSYDKLPVIFRSRLFEVRCKGPVAQLVSDLVDLVSGSFRLRLVFFQLRG